MLLRDYAALDAAFTRVSASTWRPALPSADPIHTVSRRLIGPAQSRRSGAVQPFLLEAQVRRIASEHCYELIGCVAYRFTSASER
jgi:hypothetical protein